VRSTLLVRDKRFPAASLFLDVVSVLVSEDWLV
jgi:hypothetical protein